MKQFEKIKYHLMVLLATTLVAGSFLASAKLANVVNPISLTLLRFLCALVLLFPVVVYKPRYRKKVFSTIPRAMIISFFYSLYFIFFFQSLKTTTSVNTGTLYTLVPLITAILTIFIFKQVITKKQGLVYLIGIAGTIWVVFGGDLNKLLSFSLKNGDIIFLFAVLSMSFYTISMKLLYRKDEMIVLVFCTLIGGCIWMVLGLLIFNQPLDWALIQNDSIFHMGYLIVCTTIATMFLYQITTVKLGPSKVSAYIYLNPVLVVILLFVLENVSIPFVILPGILLSVVATIVIQLKKDNAERLVNE